MRRSTERVLTTHTGSLPRPDDLLQAKESAPLPDPAAFHARVRSAVAEIVQKQCELGLDVVNDGEQGKGDYSRSASPASRARPPSLSSQR